MVLSVLVSINSVFIMADTASSIGISVLLMDTVNFC